MSRSLFTQNDSRDEAAQLDGSQFIALMSAASGKSISESIMDLNKSGNPGTLSR